VLAPLWPAYADARARGDFEWISRTLWRSVSGSADVAAWLSVAILIFSGPVMSLWLGNAVTPPTTLVAAYAGWSFVMACGTAFSYFWNGMHMVRLQAALGAFFVLVSLPLKLMLLQSGGAESLVVINAIAYLATALIPGAIITWAGSSQMVLHGTSPGEGGRPSGRTA